MTNRKRPVLLPRREPDVVTIDGLRHYLATVTVPRGATAADGPYVLAMACGLALTVPGFSVSNRDRTSCSGCAQVGPS